MVVGNIQHLTLNIQHLTLNIQHLTFSKRSPFAFQIDPFCLPKRVLLSVCCILVC